MVSDVEAKNYGIYVPCLGAQLTLKNRKCSPTEPAQPVGKAMAEHGHKMAASAHSLHLEASVSILLFLLLHLLQISRLQVR